MYLGPKVYGNHRKPRLKDEQHLKFVRTMPCPISGRYGCIAHHLLDVDGRGVAKKANDSEVIPLHPEIHTMLHNVCGSAGSLEAEWFVSRGVQPHALALFLWHNTGDYERCENFILGRTT